MRTKTTRHRCPGTLLRLLAAAAIVVYALPAFAVEPVNTNGKGVALHGYDPVAYFAEGRPVKGKAEFSHDWNGATWRFASSEHRDRFAADPESLAPQYGGYCAKAVSENHTADVDPHSWQIVGGRLYLNFSRKVHRLWQMDIPERIARADKNWPGLTGDNG